MQPLQQVQQAVQLAPHPETIRLAVAALLVSATSGLISVLTAWLTLFKRGKLKMIRPLMVAFTSRGPDGAKVVIRTTLFSSARQGNVVERLFVRISHNGTTTHTLHLWGFGDPPRFGSGLFVNQEGKPLAHHFLPPKDKRFEFFPGDTTVSVFGRVVNRKSDVLLFSETFKLTDEQAKAANATDGGVVFNTEPETGRYYPSIDVGTVEAPEGVPGPEQLNVELMPMNTAGLVIERDTRFVLHFLIRIKNCSTFPMTPRELRLNFKAVGTSFEAESGDIEVHYEFRELVPAAEQLIERAITLPRLYDQKAPPWIRLTIVGHVMAASPLWEGVKRQGVGWHSIATVTDNRPGDPPKA